MILQNQMEGWHEGFISFLKFALLMGAVFYVCGLIENDVAKRGALGKAEQQKAVQETANQYPNERYIFSNTVPARTAW